PVGRALEEVEANTPPAEPGPQPDPDSPQGQTVQILPQVPRIEALRVADVAVTYRSLANGAALTARLDELTGQVGGSLPLELRGAGTVEGQPMTITVDASGLQQLEGEGRFPLTARIEVGSTVLAVQGS